MGLVNEENIQIVYTLNTISLCNMFAAEGKSRCTETDFFAVLNGIVLPLLPPGNLLSELVSLNKRLSHPCKLFLFSVYSCWPQILLAKILW